MPVTTTPGLAALDSRLALLARRQGGVVSIRQMTEIGLRRSTIAARARRGRYTRVHDGVYAIGVGELSRRGELWAALLAAPAGTRLTARTVMELHGVRVPGRTTITVVVDRRWRGVRGVRVHESTTLRRADQTRTRGFPATSIARALLDLASDLDVDPLGKVVHELDFRNLLTARAVDDVLARNPGHPGRGRLREAMRRRGAGEAGTWSEFERRGHALLAMADPVRALRNVHVTVQHGEPVRVDAFYEAEGLCIEFDPEHHLRPRTRRGDSDRDILLDASAYTRLRFTRHDVEHRGAHVVETVRASLARRRMERRLD